MRLYGKDVLKRRLDDIAEKDRLPHAILFSGNEGCGRKTLSRYAAELFLCKKHACGECVTCRNIEHDNHPDVIFAKRVMPEGKYKAEDMRKVIADMFVKPNNGDIKVYVFEDCDSMNIVVYNTLLKIVEEPPAHLRFVFLCTNTGVIPETILSRVTEFEVPDMDAESCALCLEDKGVDRKRAKELALMFSGNVGKCLSALEDGDPEMKIIETARTAAAAIGRRDGFGMASALGTQTGRAEFAQTIDILAAIVRGALVVKNENTSADIFCKKEAERIAEEFSEDEILNMLDALFELEKNETYNLNLALSGVYLASRIF